MDFRTQIKKLCKEKGLLQKDLAKRLGITEIGLSQTLKQEYPQLQTLERIAKALNVEVSELFSPKSDFTALIDNKGELRHFHSKEELREYLDEIR